MIAFLRSTDENPDSRLQKYINVLEREHIFYLAFCWDRFKKFKNNSVFHYYKQLVRYGDGYKNILGLTKFNIFLIKELFVNRKKYKIIHACDFDTVIPVVTAKIFFRNIVCISHTGLFLNNYAYFLNFF